VELGWAECNVLAVSKPGRNANGLPVILVAVFGSIYLIIKEIQFNMHGIIVSISLK